MAYDPAENSIFWLDGPGGMTLLRKLDGEGGAYALGVDKSGQTAILAGAKAYLIPIGEGDVKEIALPEGAGRLETLQGGRVFLLMGDPAKPMWILDPAAADPLLVIPALVAAEGGQQ